MTDAETLALLKPHLTAAFVAGQEKGYATALAEAQAPARTFAADSHDEPEAERKPLAFYAAGGFTADDVARYADYFAADDGGAYPGDLHRHFSLPVRAFADTTKLLRKQVRFSDGKSGWQWVPRVAANAAANAFSEDEQGNEHDEHGKFAPKGGGGEKTDKETGSESPDPHQSAYDEWGSEDDAFDQRAADEEGSLTERHDEEIAKIDAKREKEDAKAETRRDKEDDAHEKKAEALDARVEKSDAKRKNEDGATEKRRDREDAALAKRESPATAAREKAEASREKEDDKRYARQRKESADLKTKFAPQFKAIEAEREKKLDAAGDDDEKRAAVDEHYDAATESLQDEVDIAESEQDARHTKEDAAVQDERDKEDADWDAEDEAISAERDRLQEDRDKEDKELRLAREEEDAAFADEQRELDEVAEGRQATRDKEDAETQSARDKEDAERSGRHAAELTRLRDSWDKEEKKTIAARKKKNPDAHVAYYPEGQEGESNDFSDYDTVFSEDFASFADRKDGDVWETNGRHYKRESGVTKRLRNPNAEEKDKAKREKGEAYKKTSGGLTPKEVLVKQKEQVEPKREEARAAWASAVANPNTVGAKEAPKLAELLHTLTRDEARELLRAAEEKVGGLKAELVQRMLAKLGVPTDEQRRATLEQRIAEQGLTGDAANAMRKAAGVEEAKPEPEPAKPAEPQPAAQPQPARAAKSPPNELTGRELADPGSTGYRSRAQAEAAATDVGPHARAERVGSKWHVTVPTPGALAPGSTSGGIAQLSAPDFAAKVQQAADAHTHGFGRNKTYISDVYESLKAEDPSLTDAVFKRKLLDANHSGHLELSRADLVQLMDPEAVGRSQVDHPSGAKFHFIQAAAKDRQQRDRPTGADAVDGWNQGLPQPSPQPPTAPQVGGKPARAPKSAASATHQERLTALRDRDRDPTLSTKEFVKQTDTTIGEMTDRQVTDALKGFGYPGSPKGAHARQVLRDNVISGRVARERANDTGSFEAGWSVPQRAAEVRNGETTRDLAAAKLAASLHNVPSRNDLAALAAEHGVEEAGAFADMIKTGKPDFRGKQGQALWDRVAKRAAEAAIETELKESPGEAPAPTAPTKVARAPKATAAPPAVAALAKKPLADKQHLAQLAAAAPDQTSRDYLENAAHNAPGDRQTLHPADRRHQTVERLAAEHRNALAAGHTGAADHLAKVIGEYGGKLTGAAPGEAAPFDGSLYDSTEKPGEGTLWTGRPARVLRQPILGPDGRVAVKGEVEPADAQNHSAEGDTDTLAES